jgi:hypothetical protein
MIFFLGTYSIYTYGFQIPHLKKKKTGSRSASPGFGQVVATTGLLLNPDRSSHRVDPPGRAGFNNSGFYTPMDVRKQISLT